MTEPNLNWPVPDELDMAPLLRGGLNLAVMGAIYAAHDKGQVTVITELGRPIAQIAPYGEVLSERQEP